MVGVPKRARGCEACKKRRLSVSRTYKNLNEIQLTLNSVITGIQYVLSARGSIGNADIRMRSLSLSTIPALIEQYTRSLIWIAWKALPAKAIRLVQMLRSRSLARLR